eukprot:363724-Chlamydomonas_euryale.AAC.1
MQKRRASDGSVELEAPSGVQTLYCVRTPSSHTPGGYFRWADPWRSPEVHTNSLAANFNGVERTPGTVGEVLKPLGTAFEMFPGVPHRLQVTSARLAECPTASFAPPSAPPGCQATELREVRAQWKRSGKPAAEG